MKMYWYLNIFHIMNSPRPPWHTNMETHLSFCPKSLQNPKDSYSLTLTLLLFVATVVS